MTDPKPYTFDRVFRLLVTCGFFAAFIWLLGYLSDVLLPFVVAFLLAYLLNPLVNKVQKLISNRSLAVFISLIGVALAVVVALMCVTPFVTSEIRHMGGLIKESVGNTEYSQRIREYVPENVWSNVHELISQKEVREIFYAESFLESSSKVVSKVFPKALGILKGTANFLISLLGLSVIVLYLVFLLIDYDYVRNGWENLLPQEYRKPFTEFLSDFNLIMNRHFRSQALIAMIVGILFSIGFGIIGLPLGIVLGFIIGTLNMVPYLQLLAIPPALFLAVMKAAEDGGGVATPIYWTLGIFLIVQIIQDAILTPRIMGKTTGLRPAVILLSVSLWGKLLGFLGLIIALPMTCLFLAYYRRFLDSCKK